MDRHNILSPLHSAYHSTRRLPSPAGLSCRTTIEMSGLNAIEMSGSNRPFKASRQGGPDGEPDRDESTRARRPGGYEPRAPGRADTERGRGTASLERAASASHSTTPGGRGRRRSGSSAAGATVESAAQREAPRAGLGGLPRRAFGFRSNVGQRGPGGAWSDRVAGHPSALVDGLGSVAATSAT